VEKENQVTDITNAKERERLIEEVKAAVGRWNEYESVSHMEVIRAANALAAFDADNGGSKKSNPTDAAELERLRGVEDEAATQMVNWSTDDDPVHVSVGRWRDWVEARAARIEFEKKIGGGS